MEKRFLSIIVPAYKQGPHIKQDLTIIDEILSIGSKNLDYEIICVVDGKVDNTFAEAEKVKSSKVKVVGYEHNRGKGYAVRFGMAASKGDIVGFIDSGMDLNPKGLTMLIDHFDWYDADVIVASKRHPASKVEYPWQRKLLSSGYQLLARMLFGLNVKDTQVGMKLYKREVLEKVLPRLLVKTFAFDIEILAVANYLGFTRIYEAPVDIKFNFGGSSIGGMLTNPKVIETVLRMLLDTLAIFYRLRILDYYSDSNQRKWRFDSELNFRVNTG